ncbi:MAG TPA: 4Fe-4S binding protein [Acidobacteriota bacterium]|nr:4Fe-4S binding protein [Acidobacteriota bacterium]
MNVGRCTGCGKCEDVCRFGAVRRNVHPHDPNAATFSIDPLACEGCGVCVWFCEERAIDWCDRDSGKVFVSDTRFGPMVHARLNPAEESSGKLVTRVRTVAGDLAAEDNRDLLILDGSPGIGCPVIASVTGTDLVLIVTEPTQSGEHDFERVAQLTAFFRIPTVICINKWDINPDIAARIERKANERNVSVVGKIRYDPAVTAAQLLRSSVVEYTGGIVAMEIRALWRNLQLRLDTLDGGCQREMGCTLTGGACDKHKSRDSQGRDT